MNQNVADSCNNCICNQVLLICGWFAIFGKPADISFGDQGFQWHWALPKMHYSQAAIAQLGERQTEDLKVPGSIPGLGRIYC